MNTAAWKLQAEGSPKPMGQSFLDQFPSEPFLRWPDRNCRYPPFGPSKVDNGAGTIIHVNKPLNIALAARDDRRAAEAWLVNDKRPVRAIHSIGGGHV